MESNAINVNIKYKSETFKITCPKNTTILHFKELLEPSIKAQPKQQKLIYKGKILADTDTLETYKIENDHTLIAVCSTPESKPPTQPTQFTQPSQPSPMNMPPFIPPMSTGGQNPGNPLGVPMSPYGSNPAAMMQNPMFKVMMQSMLQNPQFMETILNNDPTFKQLAESNPQFKAMLSNPELLSSLMTPENMAMAQNMMGMMGQQPGYALGGNPGSFPMPGGIHPTGESVPTTQPTVPSPNLLPQQPFPMYNPYMFQNPVQPNPVVPSQPQVNASTDYKVLYKDQLNQMKEMGFINDDANLESLKKANGNVNAAVENMLAMFK